MSKGGSSGTNNVDGGGTGGGSATGGTGATGGAGGAGGTGGTANTCVSAAPTLDPAAFSACTLCDGARCVPTAAVPPEQVAQLADCPDTPDTKCAPDKFVATAGNFVPKTCRSLLSAEGRCLSVCIPQISSQQDRLPKDVCDEGELCAPCFDPTTQEPTGACTIYCDEPKEPPKGFTECCTGVGSCVPTSLVPVDQQSQLGKDTCTGSDELCAPNELVDTTFVPPPCRSVGDTEGRCMAGCIPQVASQKDRLPQATCAATHLCAPCYDPLTGEDTGACRQNGDEPVEAPKLFAKCCNDLGACVPTSAVPPAQQGDLSKDSCATGELCAPTALTDTTYKPPTCRAIFGSLDAEGRCLPDCLASIQSQADRLSRGTCEQHHLCAPCFDPISGQPTGACEQNGDRPTEGVRTFPKCCSNGGACVPTSLIPDAQEASLGKDSCTAANVLCVPAAFSSSTYVPPACDSLGGGEGRCMPACLPDVAAQASRLPQGTCAAEHKCAPCYDPVTGVQTAACTLNGDAPKKTPPYTFPKCCAAQSGQTRGTCVPDTALSPSQATSLPQDTCPSATWSCVPNLKANNPTAKFPTCAIPGIFGGSDPGACVPNCIITDPLQLLVLARQTCAAEELCAPCTNPLTGQPSGACD